MKYVILTSFFIRTGVANRCLSSSSQIRIEEMLETFINEIRSGKREGSVMTAQTTDSLSPDDKEAWCQLRKELESVGITPTLFNQHREFIVDALQKAIIDEGLGGDLSYESYDDLIESTRELSVAVEHTLPTTSEFNTQGISNSRQPLTRQRTVFFQRQNRATGKVIKGPSRIAKLLYRIT